MSARLSFSEFADRVRAELDLDSDRELRATDSLEIELGLDSADLVELFLFLGALLEEELPEELFEQTRTLGEVYAFYELRTSALSGSE